MPRLLNRDVGVFFSRRAGVGLLNSVFMDGKSCGFNITRLAAVKEEHA